MMRLLFPLALVVAAGLIFFSFTQPVLQKIDDLRLEQAKLNTALENAKKLRQVQNELLDNYNNFAPADLDRLNKFLPDNVDNVRLIIDINNIAKASGMTIKNVKIKTEEGKEDGAAVLSADSAEPKGVVILSFGVSGSYLNFQQFLSDLSNSLRLVDIDSVTFSSNDKGIYDYAVSIRTYWLK
jgi:Tfp pilus assembly protein PilO